MTPKKLLITLSLAIVPIALAAQDLIWPVFVREGDARREPVAAMPGVDRLTVDQAVRDAERAMKLSIPCIALFPYTEPSLRDEEGSEALNPDNLVCQSVRAIKKEFPEIGVLCDVALDPFTSHGHDGRLEDGKIKALTEYMDTDLCVKRLDPLPAPRSNL